MEYDKKTLDRKIIIYPRQFSVLPLGLVSDLVFLGHLHLQAGILPPQYCHLAISPVGPGHTPNIFSHNAFWGGIYTAPVVKVDYKKLCFSKKIHV